MSELDIDLQHQADNFLTLLAQTAHLAEQLNNFMATLASMPTTLFDITQITMTTHAQVDSLHDKVYALHNHVTAVVDHLATHLDQRTSLSTDINLQLCFDNVHCQLDQMATVQMLQELRDQLEAHIHSVQAPPLIQSSQNPFLSLDHPLSPLGSNALGLTTISCTHSAPPATPSPPTLLKSKSDDDKENEAPTDDTIPYNPELPPWGNPTPTDMDL